MVGVADEGKIEWVEEFKNVCGPRFLRLTVTWDNFLAVVDSQKSREPKMWAYDWLFLLRRWHRFGPPRFGSATASASSATAIWNTLESMSCHIVGLTLEEKVLRVVSYFEDAEELARVFLAAREVKDEVCFVCFCRLLGLLGCADGGGRGGQRGRRLTQGRPGRRVVQGPEFAKGCRVVQGQSGRGGKEDLYNYVNPTSRIGLKKEFKPAIFLAAVAVPQVCFQ